MGWFTGTSSRSHSRPGYARSSAGSSYSTHRGSTSSYKRRPRDGYIQSMLHKFKRLLRRLYDYARRHPYKVFFMVAMPLISGGVLHKTAKQFGIQLPDFLKGSGAHQSRGGGGYYGSEGYGRDEMGGGMGGLGGLGSIASGMGGLGSMVKMAQAFM
ncbi:uncharacterized protein BDZ99DRAFT_463087 [Mytilinidion resinicola]|uniref:Uncharacterized protein n=1 Tax=Mytilinidion resinicola TaxID=574789 RepID=A0A6A6YR68_9PEZI|nr:uncharacterized protein BDZ99DRAFT_463087 [Mytilinidion resinicola]KAF2810524.1 hypothetical protein BDZ99DRAFT_463087 [Mytilinidion resinicola]